MNSGKDKKLTVFTKNMQNKKINLEIDTTNEHETASKVAVVQDEANYYRNTPGLNSPFNSKPAQSSNGQLNDIEQKKQQPMQKRISLKQQPIALKPQQQIKTPSNLVLNGFVSPKAALNKDKVLPSCVSQKIIGFNFKNQKRQGPTQRDSKAIRIEELQKIVEQSNIKQSQLSSKESELISQVQKLRTQNAQLKDQNGQLKKKIEKYKISSEQTKKMLKQRIHSFNEEGGEMQALKNQIKTLQQRVQSLLDQNQALKTEINKYSDYNLKELSHINGLGSNTLVISAVREVQLEGSRISQLYLKESNEGDLLQFTNFQNMEANLDLQSYISQAEESYLEEYKTNVEIFDKIKLEYENILEDIEIRYKTLAKDFQKAAQQQAAEIYDLQNQIDELVEQKEGKRQQPVLSLDLDQVVLRGQKEIAALSLTVFDLRESNKDLLEDIERHRAHCRFLQAQLDIERMKKKFKNQNDKFQYNVVKLNLLNIIDKLKMQIDKQKSKYCKLYESYTNWKNKKNQVK